MADSQLPSLEVTRSLRDAATRSGFHFGRDTALVAVQHMLLQSVDLFRTTAALGIDPRNTFALGKVYSNSAAVIELMKASGVTVIDSATPAPGEFCNYFKRDVERLWRAACQALAGRNIKRILVLDDGGICITHVPASILRRYAIAGVEQTSQGVFLFEREPPPFPVMSWARSAVKLQIGGPIFSQCLIEKLNFAGGADLYGQQLGIIGLGSIGRSISRLVARQGAQVSFFDPAPNVDVEILPAGIIRARSLEWLMRNCDYVIGCSGRSPFHHRWPMSHRPGIKLLSASGGDQEFGPIIDDLKTKPDFTVDPANWNMTSAYGPCGPIELAYLGYPYNFVSRTAEAVPTPIVQLETGGLLASLIQARIHLEQSERNPHGYLYRVAPKAQRFVFQKWRSAMRKRHVELVDVFAYDRELLRAADDDDEWFAQHTDASVSERQELVEDVMDCMLDEACAVTSLAER